LGGFCKSRAHGPGSRPKIENMKEKIYDIGIERPLTASRRKAIDKFLDESASKVKWPASYRWDEANDQLLHITVFPVKWEIWFAPKRITVYGSGPIWARMLFSENKKVMLREGIVYVLKDLGFIKVSGKMAPLSAR